MSHESGPHESGPPKSGPPKSSPDPTSPAGSGQRETVIPVGGAQPYQVLVGHDLTGRATALLPGAAPGAGVPAPPGRAPPPRLAPRPLHASPAPVPTHLPA